MVSKTLASLDAWLALAEDVLAEQHALQRKDRGPEEPDRSGQLSFFPRGPDDRKVTVLRAHPARDQ